MAGRISIINSSVHSDKAYKALSTERKLMYFQLLSHPQGNKAGFFQIDTEYMADIMCKCSETELFVRLTTPTTLWQYDPSTDVVLIPNYLKYNKIGGVKTFTSMRYELEQLPKTTLCVEFIYRLNQYTDGKAIPFLPKSMVETAKATIASKKELTVHDSIVNRLLTLNS